MSIQDFFGITPLYALLNEARRVSIFPVNNLIEQIPQVLPYIQIALSVLLAIGVLLQHSDASLGGAFGGGDNWSSTFHTRRGFEKVLFNGTIIIAILFPLSSILAITL